MHLVGFIIGKGIVVRVKTMNILLYELLKGGSKIFAAFIFGKASRV